jgi:protoporphyrin/coproporphyrin ferrochelatase
MAKIGVVIGNLGTPQTASVSDVKAYLKQFLMDPYVIDKPFWFRALLVYGIIAPLRSRQSAKAYQSVWTEEGSPLLVYSQKLVAQLQKSLGESYKVVLGMRYGQPSIRSALEQVQDCEKIILFPQYPQYAESSTRTWVDEAEQQIHALGIRAPVTSVDAFYREEEYLHSLSSLVARELQGKEIDLLFMSYHGLPERHIKKLDTSGKHCLQIANCCDRIIECNSQCYRAQCFYVSRELSKRLGNLKYEVAFQSRLGRDPWIQPFTDKVLEELPRRGVKKIAVVMPAFTVDCLETLEEIHDRAKEQFFAAGGESFYAIRCLNDDEVWVEQLTHFVKRIILN